MISPACAAQSLGLRLARDLQLGCAMRHALYALPFVILLGCSSATDEGEEPSPEPATPFGASAGPTGGGTSPTGGGQPRPTPPPPAPVDATITEVVHVVIDGG